MSSISFSIIQARNDVGAAIKSGDTVVLKVIQSLAGGKWQVSQNGKLLAIRSTVDLVPGQWIRARAEVSGNSILLHLITMSETQPREAPFVQAEGAAGKDAEFLLLAFKRAGLSVDSTFFFSAKKVFKQIGKQNRTTAAILAALAEKGILPDPGLVDYIGGILEWGSNRQREGHRKDQSDSENTSEHTVESIKEKLKSHVERSADEDGLLQLFNHVKGKGESWILIPYSMVENTRHVEGVIRLRIDRYGEIKRLCMDATHDKASFSFSFDWPVSTSGIVKIGCSDPQTLRKFFEMRGELPEKLRNLRSINDDNNIEGEGIDLLNLEPVPNYGRINTLA